MQIEIKISDMTVFLVLNAVTNTVSNVVNANLINLAIALFS